MRPATADQDTDRDLASAKAFGRLRKALEHAALASIQPQFEEVGVPAVTETTPTATPAQIAGWEDFGVVTNQHAPATLRSTI